MNYPLAVVNGPNLNKLGKREPKIYGTQTWEMIWSDLQKWSEVHSIPLTYFQSNSEGGLIDHLQEVEEKAAGVLFNPGAYAHTSIALRDCVAGLSIPVVEIHLSKTGRRESFRAHSFIAEVAKACIVGFGVEGYLLGLDLLKTIGHDRTQQR